MSGGRSASLDAERSERTPTRKNVCASADEGQRTAPPTL